MQELLWQLSFTSCNMLKKINKETLKKNIKIIAENIKGFMYGFFIESAVDLLEREAYEEQDLYTLILFSDLLGIPNPISYYTIELLPYMSEDMENWEKRMLRKGEVLAEQFGKHGFSP